MAHHLESDVSVQRFGYTGDAAGKRLTFPRAESHRVEGRSGSMTYGADELLFDQLEGRLDTLRWTAAAGSLGGAWLRDDSGRVSAKAARFELPRGARLVRAHQGVEIVVPSATLTDLRLTIKGPFSAPAVPAPPVSPEPLRQDQLHFLDSLQGRIDLTIKVALDLPVLGKRTLDQSLKIPVNEGSLDYRKLEDSLDWLEGRFLDIKHRDTRLAVTWKVPVIGSAHELIAWQLDDDAAKLASFGRVPVRSLADYRVGGGPPGAKEQEKKRRIVQSLTFDAIDVALSLLAPRSMETGGGLVMFGGENEPGMVDLKVTGAIRDQGPGSLRGAIGSVDTTVKDVQFGGAKLTADRLHFDGLDELEVQFDGWTPSCVTMIVHRVTATNLSIQLGQD
ncbi:MAG TPA: hypothetical protein VGM88_21240 [Kofleriaceae bacterium]|jgi:hypothetical protein